MSAPKNEAIQTQAYTSLLPNVELIKSFYDLSTRLGHGLVHLLEFFEGKDPLSHQAILKQLADLLDFVLDFDMEKMMKPALQNDFAYYRRNYSKISQLPGLTVHEAEANIISMFIAQNLPFMVACEKSIKGMGERSSEETGNALALLANIMCGVAEQDRDDETLRYALRVMTGAMVLYDRVTISGVFAKTSMVNIRKCLRVLNARASGATASLVNQLTSCLKYSTVHYKDATTPRSVLAALGD